MYHIAHSAQHLPDAIPIEPDPCALLVFRRARYLAYLRRRVGSVDAAEDVFQDFAVKVIRAARDVQPGGNAEAWVFRVLRNTLFDHYRRKDARLRAEADFAVYNRTLGESGDGDPTEPGPDEHAMRALEAALASIRPDQAEVIRALYLRGIPREALARKLRLEVGTLNVRAFRARRALRDALTHPVGGCRGEDDAVGFGATREGSGAGTRKTNPLCAA